MLLEDLLEFLEKGLGEDGAAPSRRWDLREGDDKLLKAVV